MATKKRKKNAGNRFFFWILIGLWALTLAILPLDSRKKISQFVNREWTKNDRTPVSMVTSLAQTKEGYLWVGTQEGLLRFNGVDFQKFNTQNTGEMKSNYITALFSDRSGMLWIGSRSGLVNFVGGRFYRLQGSEMLADDIVHSFYEDDCNQVWISSEIRGLTIYKKKSFYPVIPDIQLDFKSINEVCGGRDGSLWLGTHSGLIQYFENAWKTFLKKEPLTGKPMVIYHLLYDEQDFLWLGTNRGLVKFKNEEFHFLSQSKEFPPHHVRSLHRDSEGVIWIGTDGAGLFQWQDNQFTRLGKEDGLSGNMVYAILEDQEQSLWVGTYSGLNQLIDPRVVTFTSQHGLPDDTVWSICEDHQGRIWFATNGGLGKYENGRFSSFSTKEGLSSSLASCVYPSRDGSLWIGLYDSWLHRFKNNSFSAFSLSSGNAIMDVTCILEDREGILWIGTFGHGLYGFSRGKFDRYDEKDGLPSNSIFSLCEHWGKGLWIGTDGGGIALLKDRQFRVYKKEDGLSSNTIMALFEDDKGILWVGTEGGGLNRLDRGKITRFTVREGLLEDVIYQILEDDQGNLWLSGNYGISRVSKSELENFSPGQGRMISPAHFGLSDGMKALECSGGYQPAGWKTAGGKLWFPTIKGAVMIDPLNLEIIRKPPPLVIEKVLLDGKQFAYPKGELEVNAGIHKIEIYFTALSFVSPEDMKFKYRLEGYEKEWLDHGNRKDRIAGYTNISPGRYRFQVIAGSSQDNWNKQGASIGFMVYPPFWRTWWFVTLSLLLFSILSYMTIHFARKYIKLVAFWRKKNYIGHFRIREKIASGGMGTIYRASDILNDRIVALKVLREELTADSIQRKRFINEGSIIDQIDHPNIVKVIERGEYNNQLYIAMELLEGISLSELIGKGVLIPIAESIDMMAQSANVLDRIHRKGIFHRDLKPENIMLIRKPEKEYFIKLLDFGLAKTESLSRLTETGMVIGTIAYLPPEQITEGQCTAASDVYSLGVIFYEMLTLKKPFSGGTSAEIMKKILHQTPVRPSEHRADIPPELEDLILGMISRDPCQRPTLDRVLESLSPLAVPVQE